MDPGDPTVRTAEQTSIVADVDRIWVGRVERNRVLVGMCELGVVRVSVLNPGASALTL